MIIEEVKTDPSLNVGQIIDESKADISETTARRVLKANKYKCMTASRKWAIGEQQCYERLTWAKEYIKKPSEYWKKVVFTDECRVQRNPNKQKVWALEKSDVPPIETNRWQISIMVWGAITYKKVSILEVINGEWKSTNYLAMLKRRLLKNLPNLKPEGAGGDDTKRLIFQQDGATLHTSLAIIDYFNDCDIEVVNWPPRSLTPI